MEKPAIDLIGREMRKRYDMLLPKAPIPDRILRLLIALEQSPPVRAASPSLG